MSRAGTFAGDAADHYAEYRRGYRPSEIEFLAGEFALRERSKVLDLGCGTGQLTVPLAAHAGCVIGMDPSADMLTHARRKAKEAGVGNTAWLVGYDSDLGDLEPLLGEESLRLVTIGQALHWMAAETVFTTLWPLLEPGGGVAVIANGTPVWTQDAPWVDALRDTSSKWLGPLRFPACGSSEEERTGYAELLVRTGYTEVGEHRADYREVFGIDEFIGSFYSAAPRDRLAPEQWELFDEDLRQALSAAQPDGRFTEEVPVRILTSRKPKG
ncbi:class I SAM-dependent methyltransferase [Amycolatopsis sp. 195334CR]|uniref:class I SAM-dependent methyltransferase n=1 Tax=Amycolatopsis sp. 195334CR TaxID=2814588 RepID=UPI001A8EF4C7|nr:class I SAM-dependent methyltransferase [Amycolatopsis sp. 195334CR]MBN6037346.1 methyltransferase domain-containing protein [Amycolatopsis sp. 195334CR]